MSVATFSEYIRELSALAPSISIYAAGCGTAGAISYFLAPVLGLDAINCSLYGSVFPLLPMVWICNSNWWIRWDLVSVKQMETEKLGEVSTRSYFEIDASPQIRE